MWQAKLYYEDNKCYIYILQIVNTTDKMEMLRKKNTKYQTEVKQSKQNRQWNKWTVETETENK